MTNATRIWTDESAARRLIGYVIVLFLSIVVACDHEDAPVAPGPCIHEYREPILLITDARDVHTDSLVADFVLTNIRHDGRQLEALFLATPGRSHGVTARGDSLLCHVPCGFATDPGNHVFTVSAPGYPPQDRGYEAQYRVFVGGCPSFNDGGLQISLRLWHE